MARHVLQRQLGHPERRPLDEPRRPPTGVPGLRRRLHVDLDRDVAALLGALRQPLERRQQADLLQHDRPPPGEHPLHLLDCLPKVLRQAFHGPAILGRVE